MSIYDDYGDRAGLNAKVPGDRVTYTSKSARTDTAKAAGGDTPYGLLTREVSASPADGNQYHAFACLSSVRPSPTWRSKK